MGETISPNLSKAFEFVDLMHHKPDVSGKVFVNFIYKNPCSQEMLGFLPYSATAD